MTLTAVHFVSLFVYTFSSTFTPETAQLYIYIFISIKIQTYGQC